MTSAESGTGPVHRDARGWRATRPVVEGPDRGKRRRRVVWWIVPAAVVVVVALACLGVRHELQSSGAFHVGTCFQITDNTGIVATGGLREVTGRAKVVNCGTTHDGEITRAVRNASDCTAEGAWLDSLEQIYCVRLAG